MLAAPIRPDPYLPRTQSRRNPHIDQFPHQRAHLFHLSRDPQIALLERQLHARDQVPLRHIPQFHAVFTHAKNAIEVEEIEARLAEQGQAAEL